MSSTLADPSATTSSQTTEGFDELWALFSFQGRMNRRQYLQTWVAQSILLVLFGGLFGVLLPFKNVPYSGYAMGLLVLTGLFVSGWIALATRVKRYHDFDYSGWAVLIALIPGLGWGFDLLALHLTAGTPGPNRFDR